MKGKGVGTISGLLAMITAFASLLLWLRVPGSSGGAPESPPVNGGQGPAASPPDGKGPLGGFPKGGGSPVPRVRPKEEGGSGEYMSGELRSVSTEVGSSACCQINPVHSSLQGGIANEHSVRLYRLEGQIWVLESEGDFSAGEVIMIQGLEPGVYSASVRSGLGLIGLREFFEVSGMCSLPTQVEVELVEAGGIELALCESCTGGPPPGEVVAHYIPNDVTLSWAGMPPVRAEFDPGGACLLNGLVPGRYDVRIPLNSKGAGLGRELQAMLRVEAGSLTSLQPCSCGMGGLSISGRLFDGSDPVAEVEVSLSQVTGGGAKTESVVLDAQGRFGFQVSDPGGVLLECLAWRRRAGGRQLCGVNGDLLCCCGL